MAEIPTPKDKVPDDQDLQDVSSNGDSTDQDFDLTADMMVHDMDDETTLEEEELNEDSENVADELAELEKEGDMPIEDLLAIYGYTDEPVDQSEAVPLEEIKPDPLPPLVSASTDQDFSNQSDGDQEGNSRHSVQDGDDSSVASPSTQDQSDYAPSPPPASSKNDVFPENQRITRGILAAYNYFNLGETSSSDDDDNEYNPEEWKKEIRMGPEHQAEVPESMYSSDDEYKYEGQDKCLWNPTEITDKELQTYLNTISLPLDVDGDRKDVIRDDEQALYMLLQCNYDVREALQKKNSQGNPKAEMTLWSEEECRDFESGLRMFGKDFRQIQQNKVTSRTVGEIVQFYYLWKKTERHDAFACQTRLAKKKYSFHPGITDYMDRFLDDNESAASSRASSPHNLAGRNRIGNGYLSSQSTSTSTTQSTLHSLPSGSSHTTVTMVSGTSKSSHHHHHHHNHQHLQLSQATSHGATHLSPGKPPQLLQHCVPTSVIVSSHESPSKRPRMEHDNIPRLLNTTMSKPPPLKPIISSSSVPSSTVHRSYMERSHIGESSSVHRSQGSSHSSLSGMTGVDSYHHHHQS